MLDDFFGAHAVKRLRCCVLGPYLDEFCTWLGKLGYRVATIRAKLLALSVLARWMTKEQLAVGDLDEHRIDEFVQ